MIDETHPSTDGRTAGRSGATDDRRRGTLERASDGNGRRVVRARRSWRSWTETETRTEERADGRGRARTEERAARARAREKKRGRRGFCVCVWFGFFVLGDDARGARRRSVVTRGAFVNGEDD